MKQKDARAIMMYYGSIDEMVKLLEAERAGLEDQYYNAMGAAAADGLPHSNSPGKPVEAMAIHAAEKGAGDRLREIDTRLEALRADDATIRCCVDGLCGRYKLLLVMRYLYRYTWGKIAVKMEVPDSTARNWHERALGAVGQALDDMPMAAELLARASRARV